MPHYILTIAPASAHHTYDDIVGVVESVSQKRALADTAHRVPEGHTAQVTLYSSAMRSWQNRADARDDEPRLRRQAAQTDAARIAGALRSASVVDVRALSEDVKRALAAAVEAMRHAHDLAERETATIVAETTETEQSRTRAA